MFSRLLRQVNPFKRHFSTTAAVKFPILEPYPPTRTHASVMHENAELRESINTWSQLTTLYGCSTVVLMCAIGYQSSVQGDLNDFLDRNRSQHRQFSDDYNSALKFLPINPERTYSALKNMQNDLRTTYKDDIDEDMLRYFHSMINNGLALSCMMTKYAGLRRVPGSPMNEEELLSFLQNASNGSHNFDISQVDHHASLFERMQFPQMFEPQHTNVLQHFQEQSQQNEAYPKERKSRQRQVKEQREKQAV